MRLRLTEPADLAVIHAADAARYAGRPQHPAAAVTVERFAAYFRGCRSIGFTFDGRPIGGMLLDGRQAHMAVLPEYHGRWALLWRPALQWLFAQVPEAIGAVEADNQTCIAFMDRNGWPRVEERDGRVIYLMTPLKSGRTGMSRPPSRLSTNAPEAGGGQSVC
jgi:hypothetical protein